MLILTAFLLACDVSVSQTPQAPPSGSGRWSFPALIGPDRSLVVIVNDRTGLVRDARGAVNDGGVPPVGGIAVSAGHDDAKSLLLQVVTSICGDTSEVTVTGVGGGRILVTGATQSRECDAIGVSYALILDFDKPVPPEQVIRHTLADGEAKWGLFVHGTEEPRPLELVDGTGSIVAVDSPDVMPVVPTQPSGIAALVDSPTELRISWLADDCEDAFSLELVPSGSRISARLRGSALESEACDVATRPLAVAISFAEAVAQRVDPSLIRSR